MRFAVCAGQDGCVVDGCAWRDVAACVGLRMTCNPRLSGTLHTAAAAACPALPACPPTPHHHHPPPTTHHPPPTTTPHHQVPACSGLCVRNGRRCVRPPSLCPGPRGAPCSCLCCATGAWRPRPRLLQRCCSCPAAVLQGINHVSPARPPVHPPLPAARRALQARLVRAPPANVYCGHARWLLCEWVGVAGDVTRSRG